MYYPQEIIEQVIEANNIVDIVSEYVKLTKKGSTYFGLCPFHNEKTPSFSVTDNGSRKMFYCFGCHSGGNALTFIMKYENSSYAEALKILADRAGIHLPEPKYSKEDEAKHKLREQIFEVNRLAALYFVHLLRNDRGKQAMKYLTDRKLDDNTIKQFGLGYSDKYRDDLYRFVKSKGYSDEVLKATGLFRISETDTHDYFWNRVMFPIMDTRNRVIAFGGRVMGDGEPKYLNSPETMVFEKSKTLFGLHAARKNKENELILCEGYMDVISLHQAGFTNAVASLGTALTTGHVSVLKRYTNNVLISYDSDGAGRDAALRAIPKLRELGMIVKVVNLKPYKDPDELIKAEGADEYRNRLRHARNSFLFEIDVLSESFDMNDPDRKTGFYNEVAKKLSYINDEIERENYLQTVSQEYRIDYKMLRDRTVRFALSRDDGKGYEPVRKRPERDAKEASALEESQKTVLKYIADTPGLYEKVKAYIDKTDFISQPYGTIAEILFNQISNGRINISAVIGAFEDEKEQELAADILSPVDQNIAPEVWQKAITECIINIKRNTVERIIRSETDMTRVLMLSREKEQLRNLKIF